MPLPFSLIIYFKIGLTITFAKFAVFYLTILLIAFCFSGIGYMISSIFSESNTAASLAPIIQTPLMMFAGFF